MLVFLFLDRCFEIDFSILPNEIVNYFLFYLVVPSRVLFGILQCYACVVSQMMRNSASFMCKTVLSAFLAEEFDATPPRR